MAGDNHIYEHVKVKNRCWNAYFTACLRELYIKTELCDTILIAGAKPSGKTLLESELLYNKSLFPAHKCVLGAVSPYLKNLFKGDPHGYEFTVPVVTGDALRHTLDFIYSGESDVPPEHIDDLYCAAIVLQVESLSFQIKKAATKTAAHWETLRGTTLQTLNPNDHSRRRKRKKSEERENSIVDSEPSEHNSSVHSNDGKKDVGNELLQHLIMDTKEEPISPPPSTETQQPVFPYSQPVFPGQEEPPVSPEKNDINLNSASPKPRSKTKENGSRNVRNELLQHLMMDTKKERSSPSLPRLPNAVEQPVFPSCSQPVFPGQEEPDMDTDRPSNNNDSDEKGSGKEEEKKEEQQWPVESQTPIVIEPSMAYNLYEMAQRHHESDDVATADRYGFSPPASHKDPHSSNNGADAGPSASSVLRSLLKRQEKHHHQSPPAPSPHHSASSTLRAMLRQGPLNPAWPSPRGPTSSSGAPAWPPQPPPPPVSSQRLKALLGARSSAREDVNGAARGAEREDRKRGSGGIGEGVDVGKRKRTISPPPRSMPAALRPIGSGSGSGSGNGSGSSDKAKPPAPKDTPKSPFARVTRSQSSEQPKDSGDGETSSAKPPSPMHPILFSILKEPNLRCKTKEEPEDTEEEDNADKLEKERSRVVGHQPLFTVREEQELHSRIAQRLRQGEATERADILRLAHDFAVALGKRDRAHPLSRKWYYGFVKRMRTAAAGYEASLGNESGNGNGNGSSSGSGGGTEASGSGSGSGGRSGGGSNGGGGGLRIGGVLGNGFMETLVENAIQEFERNAGRASDEG